MRYTRAEFWAGFGAGAAVASAIAALAKGRSSRPTGVERIECSTQIARPVDQVFQYFFRPDRMSPFLPELQCVSISGNRQHWRATVNGMPIEWDAEVTRVIPNQAIGWKTINGPKHTGRVNFAPIGNDTQVHLVMNYAPGFWQRWFGIAAHSATQTVEDGLAHLKQALERKGFDVAGTGERRPPDSIESSLPSSAQQPR